jgi:hypothetical protein
MTEVEVVQGTGVLTTPALAGYLTSVRGLTGKDKLEALFLLTLDESVGIMEQFGELHRMTESEVIDLAIRVWMEASEDEWKEHKFKFAQAISRSEQTLMARLKERVEREGLQPPEHFAKRSEASALGAERQAERISSTVETIDDDEIPAYDDLWALSPEATDQDYEDQSGEGWDGAPEQPSNFLLPAAEAAEAAKQDWVEVRTLDLMGDGMDMLEASTTAASEAEEVEADELLVGAVPMSEWMRGIFEAERQRGHDEATAQAKAATAFWKQHTDDGTEKVPASEVEVEPGKEKKKRESKPKKPKEFGARFDDLVTGLREIYADAQKAGLPEVHRQKLFANKISVLRFTLGHFEAFLKDEPIPQATSSHNPVSSKSAPHDFQPPRG